MGLSSPKLKNVLYFFRKFFFSYFRRELAKPNKNFLYFWEWNFLALYFSKNIYVYSFTLFSSSEFSSSEFCLSESSEEVSMLSVINLGVFFSFTIYLHSSKKHLRIIVFYLLYKLNQSILLISKCIKSLLLVFYYCENLS